MRLEKITAFVVYAFALGEADQLVTCFSSEGNLVKFIAKGSRKTMSRFAAAVQLFNLGEYVVYRGKGLPILRQAEIMESFAPIRRDWTKSGAALSVLELCRLLIAEEARETESFRLVLAYFHHLKANDYTSLAFDAFRLQFVEALGYGINFSTCVACGRPADRAGGFLRWSEGGTVCSLCRTQGLDYIRLNSQQLSLLCKLQHLGFSQIDALMADSAQKRICRELVDSLIFWLTEGKAKTQAFRKLFEDGCKPRPSS